MRTRLILLLSLMIELFFAAGNVGASCGSASCPIDTYTTEQSEKGMIRLDYTYEYIDQHTPMAGREKVSEGEIPGDHNEISTLNQIQRFGLDMGLSSRLSLNMSLPFVHREHQHFDTADNELQSWNFDGLGDLNVLTRYAFLKPNNNRYPILSAIAGGIFPTGRHHAVNTEGEEAEPGIQPGTGAWSLILGVSSLQMFSQPTLTGANAQMPFFLSTTYQWNGTGNSDYRLGNIWLANAGTVYPLLPKVGLITQLNLRVCNQDAQGNTDQQVDRTGGSFVYISPGLQLTMANNLWGYAIVQLPVYQRVNVIQLTSSYNFFSGLSYKFSAL